MHLQKSIISLITLILISGCTLGNVAPNDEIILETLIANTVLTAAAEAKNNITPTVEIIPTDTPMPPTEIPTLVPTPTPTEITVPVRFIDDPGNRWGDPSWTHTFDEDIGWSTYDAEFTKLSIEDGELRFLSREANNRSYWRFTYIKLQDVYIEFLTRNPVSCAGNDRYGLVLRSPDNQQGYFLGFNCLGQYSLVKLENANSDFLIPWTDSELIDKTPTGFNRIAIIMNHDMLTIHINGVDVNTVYDSSFRSGSLGMFIASENTPNFTAAIEEINFWVIP